MSKRKEPAPPPPTLRAKEQAAEARKLRARGSKRDPATGQVRPGKVYGNE